MANGTATGADCQQGSSDAAGTAVENGMPATKHQQEVLKTDDKAVKGNNMEATGTGGDMPASAAPARRAQEARERIRRRSEAQALS